MGFIGKHRLVAHPEHRPKSVRSVEVSLWGGSQIMLSYGVQPAACLVLPDYGFERLDGLWRSTCFELFVKPRGHPDYREFNFAPIGGWNAYSFSDWRKGMTTIEDIEPLHLVDCRVDERQRYFPGRYELDVVLGRDFAGELPAKISLAAVIEEKDGTKSYWALRHPPGKPDFHHPDCFALQLPPPSDA